VEGDSSAGPVFRYDAATDTFSHEVDTAAFIGLGASNVDGSVTMIGSGLVLDASLTVTGTIPGCGTAGVAVNRAGTVGYGLGYDRDAGQAYLAVCDLVRFQVVDVVWIGAALYLGRLAISPDDGSVVGITDSGVVLFRPAT